MDDVAVGLALRRIRLRRNERQADVAARADVAPSTYYEIERATSTASRWGPFGGCVTPSKCDSTSLPGGGAAISIG
ncbi:MAG: hypothetical protein AB1736_11915 [Chloroflexota bacterium]